MQINAESPDRERPYANLLPIAEALAAAGNSILDGGFVLTQGGWECRLGSPIDFDLVSSQFVLPASIEASPRHDSILDRLSWCVIEGSTADAARQRLPGDIHQR
ncbi:MAG TPA: hypothetical protein VEX41_02540 [Candidatus Eisenbacteria bacterium]|nr:hypothetical protein [Candidatus Eisenbacteria bacterium]